jgi:hypothetical protein
MSRFRWRYLRFLRGVGAVILVFALATVGHHAPVSAAVAAAGHALATLGAILVALMMAGFGAFFAVRG